MFFSSLHRKSTGASYPYSGAIKEDMLKNPNSTGISLDLEGFWKMIT